MRRRTRARTKKSNPYTEIVKNLIRWGEHDYRRITYAQYKSLLIESVYKDSEKSALVRTVCEYIINFGGMGSGKHISLNSVMPLPLIDNRNVILPIRSREQAIGLIKEMIAGL